MGPVFAVVTHGTGLALAGPFLLWCWNRTTIKSIRSHQSGLPSLPHRRGWGMAYASQGAALCRLHVLDEKMVSLMVPGRLWASLLHFHFNRKEVSKEFGIFLGWKQE